MNEIWKPVPGYEGFYEASNLGRIKSLPRLDPQGRQVKGGIMGTWKKWKQKYMMVGLRTPGTLRMAHVHSVIALAFLGEPPQGKCVAHNDGNPENNELANLRFATPQENIDDKKLHGTQTSGENHPMARYTDQQILAVRSLYKILPNWCIAQMFNMRTQYVTSMGTGASKRIKRLLEQECSELAA